MSAVMTAIAPYARAIKITFALGIAAGLFAGGYCLRDVMAQRDVARVAEASATGQAAVAVEALDADRANAAAGTAVEVARGDRIVTVNRAFAVIERKARAHEQERVVPVAAGCDLDAVELWAWNAANAGSADAEPVDSAGVAGADAGAAAAANGPESEGDAR